MDFRHILNPVDGPVAESKMVDHQPPTTSNEGLLPPPAESSSNPNPYASPASVNKFNPLPGSDMAAAMRHTDTVWR